MITEAARSDVWLLRVQRRAEDSDEETAAPRIISRHRVAESDDDEVTGDVPRRRPQQEDDEEEEDDEEGIEARRAAVRERYALCDWHGLVSPASICLATACPTICLLSDALPWLFQAVS